jgi:uncharacterized protein
MKKVTRILPAAFLALALSLVVGAQTTPEKRMIEVTGSAETLITPNEFTFKITLYERIENKEKLTIEKQEARLKSELGALGVDVAKDLSVFDLTSTYIARKKTKDTLGSKDYRLKIKDLAKIERLQEIADRLNIANLDLIESTHSDLVEFRKQTKMEALKAAKAKAEYMLGAIGERVGKSVYIQEIPDETAPRPLSYGVNSNTTSNVVATESQDAATTLAFSQIKLRYAVLARFEIE